MTVRTLFEVHALLKGFRLLLLGALVLCVAALGVFEVYDPLAIANPSNSTDRFAAQVGLVLGAAGAGMFQSVLYLGRRHAVSMLVARGLPYPELALGVAFILTRRRMIDTLRGKDVVNRARPIADVPEAEVRAMVAIASRLHRRMVASLLPLALEVVLAFPLLDYMIVVNPPWASWGFFNLILFGSAFAVAISELLLLVAWRAADRAVGERV